MLGTGRRVQYELSHRHARGPLKRNALTPSCRFEDSLCAWTLRQGLVEAFASKTSSQATSRVAQGQVRATLPTAQGPQTSASEPSRGRLLIAGRHFVQK